MKSKLIIIITLLISFHYNASAQVNIKDSSVFASIFYVSLGYQIPAGDMAKRFGSNSNIGGGFLLKTKSNLLFDVDCNYIFGNNIKNESSVLECISTSEGYVIDGNGMYADINLNESGFYASYKMGKLFPVFNENPNSGIVFISGIGMLQHKIRIDNKDNTAPQIKGDYKKGYDKLTNGLAVTEFIGYMHLSKKHIANFFAGFEFIQAWTKCRRIYDFNKMAEDNSKHFDMLSGFKIGWVIPIYKQAPKKYYYY